MTPSYLSVGGAADELAQTSGQTIRPRWITDLFYQRELRDDLCPIIGGRRLIPRDYLPMIAIALRRHGWIGQSPNNLSVDPGDAVTCRANFTFPFSTEVPVSSEVAAQLPTPVFSALERILDHLWRDEQLHYLSCANDEEQAEHIFSSLKTINSWLAAEMPAEFTPFQVEENS
ncbi:MAG: hypothetical protein ACYSWU_14070 [Planctomycetota bacterium]|jgi:hypothetical protein